MALVNVQEVVTLSCQLFDGATNMYVLARVIDPSGGFITGSPFQLPHVFGGLYENNTLQMPNLAFIVVQYKVYQDPGYTIPSVVHGDAQDIFYREDNKSAFILGAELSQTDVFSAELLDDTLSAELVGCG